MATVVYQPGLEQSLGLLMNLYDMIQNRKMVNAYKEDVTKTLGERQTGREFETTQQQKQTQINTPTGWTYEPQDKGFRYVDGKMVPFTEGAGDFVPTGFETQTTEVPVDVQRQRSPEELKSYDIQTRRMLDTLGAGVPPSVRADTRAFTMWPEEGGESPDDKVQRRLAGMRPNLWELQDEEGNRIATHGSLYPPENLVGRKIRGKTVANVNLLEKPSQTIGGQAREVSTAINLQKLLANYSDDPSSENEIALKNAYKAKGITLVKPKSNLWEKAKDIFGQGNIPFLVGIDKKGNYINIDESGNETTVPKKKSLSDKYGY